MSRAIPGNQPGPTSLAQTGPAHPTHPAHSCSLSASNITWALSAAIQKVLVTVSNARDVKYITERHDDCRKWKAIVIHRAVLP